MKFQKTNSDIHLIRNIPPENLKMDFVLKLMLDVMQDTIEETGMVFKNESIPENGAAAFIAVVKALNSLKTDCLTGESVSAGRRERLKAEKEKLAQTENDLNELEQVLQEQQQTGEKMREKLTSLNEKQERSHLVQKEIDTLQKQLDEIPDVDEKALADLKRQLEEKVFLLSDKQQEYIRLSGELKAAQTELETTLHDIDEVRKQKSETDSELEQKKQCLDENKKSRDGKLNTKNQYIGQIALLTQEISGIDTELAVLEKDLDQQKTIKDSKAARKLQQENSLAALEEDTAKLEKEENELKQKSLSLIRSIQSLTTSKQQLETEIAQKTQEYQEKSKQTGEDIIRLSETLSKLNEQIYDCEQSVADLQNDIADREIALSELQKSTNQLETQKNERQSELAQKNGKKQHMEDELRNCSTQLEALRLFFDSEECQEQNSRIAKIKESIALYQTAVQELFQKEISVYLLFDDCGEEMTNKKNILNSQIRQLENDMSCLKNTYIQTVTDIERRINQW